MKKLILIRHGKAKASQGDDVNRALAPKGVAQIRSIGQKLLIAEHIPDIVYTSVALRTKETTELLLKEWESQSHIPLVQETSVIYQAYPETLIKLIRGIPETYQSLGLVGHNPAFEDLAGILSGRPAAMGTGNCIILIFPIDSWQQIDSQQAISSTYILP